jgi:hypothetical protein
MYMRTQLSKMLFLATFFPMPDTEEKEAVQKFDFALQWILRFQWGSTVQYIVMQCVLR